MPLAQRSNLPFDPYLLANEEAAFYGEGKKRVESKPPNGTPCPVRYLAEYVVASPYESTHLERPIVPRTRVVFLLLPFVLFATHLGRPQPLAATYFVDDDALGDPGPNDPNVSNPLEDGSEAYPFDRIQEALDIAMHGDGIRVLAGTFREDLLISNRGAIIEGSGQGQTVIGSASGGGLFAYFVLGLEPSPRFILQRLSIADGIAIACSGCSSYGDVAEFALSDVTLQSGGLGLNMADYGVVSLRRMTMMSDDLTITTGPGSGIDVNIDSLSAPLSHVRIGPGTDGHPFLNVQNSTVAGITGAGILDASADLVVRNVRFTGQGIASGGFSAGQNARIEDSVFEQGGIEVQGSGGPDPGAGLNLEVIRSEFRRDGIRLLASGSAGCPEEAVTHFYNLLVDSSRFMRDGILHRIRDGVHATIARDCGTASGGTAKVRIVNSIFDRCLQGVGVAYDYSQGLNSVAPLEYSLQVVNNTFHGCTTGIRVATDHHPTGLDRSVTIIKNNIIVDGSIGLEVRGKDDQTLEVSSNDLHANQAGDYIGDLPDQTGANGNISIDPAFADPTAGNFSLQPSSPCIDTGAIGPDVPRTDHAGTARPQDGDNDGIALPDIGALEFIFRDADGDGIPAGADCDDTDPSVHPSAPDLPGNRVDEDCDGSSSCDPSQGWQTHGAFVRCVRQACGALVASGAVSQAQCQSLVTDAARSGVGRGNRRGPSTLPAAP